MFSRVGSKNRVFFIHLSIVKLLMKLLRSTQHYRRWKKWAFILAFLLKQVCSQAEKSVVPWAFWWALRKLPFWFSFSLLVWDYRRLALIVLKLKADSVKGKISLLNCSHWVSLHIAASRMQTSCTCPCCHDFEEKLITLEYIGGEIPPLKDRWGFRCFGGFLFGWLGFSFWFCMCGLYVAGCCLPPPQRVFALPLLCHQPALVTCLLVQLSNLFITSCCPCQTTLL